MEFYVAHNEDIRPVFDENGVAAVELLPGTYDGGIENKIGRAHV